MKLIVGIGNYGLEYKQTRHNMGFMVLDYFLGNNFNQKFNAMYCEKNINGVKVIFIKPLTYVNLSGEAVLKYANYFKIAPKDILIVHDDLDLPYLHYRLKYKSSSGGHNGIKSIISLMKTDEIPRLKIGIAHDKSVDTKDYVLSKLNQDELKLLEEKMPLFKKIIIDFIINDIEYCMKEYNKK